jgi:benzoate-CoA ligase family protein
VVLVGDLTYQTPSGKISITETFNAASLHVDRNVASSPNKIAILSQERTLTYKELESEVSKNGNALRSLGAKKTDVVLIALSDTPLNVAAFLGAMKIGAVPAIVNPASSVAEIEYMVQKSDAKFLLCTAQTAHHIKKEKHSITCDVLTVEGKAEGCVEYTGKLSSADSNLQTLPTSRDDPAYVVFSSGTTGKPKAVLHLHKDLVFTTYQFLNEVMHATANDVYYSGSRLFFSAGRMFSLHLPLMSGATTILVNARPRPEVISNTLSVYRPSVFLAIPSLYSALMKSEEAAEIELDTSSLRLCLSGGEPLPPAVFQKWKQTTGLEIIGAIGSSEAEWHFISQFQGKVKPEATGKVVPGWELKLLDERGTQITSPLTLGTAWIKSDSVADRYLNDPENTSRKFVHDWFNTDDVFYFDKEGYYYFVGRNDSLFKVKGRWVSPIEIETVILEHPSVLECVVFSTTDDEGLNRPRALVVLKQGTPDPKELASKIFQFVAERLPDYKTPIELGFVDFLEKTSNGKIRRTNLGGSSAKVQFYPRGNRVRA